MLTSRYCNLVWVPTNHHLVSSSPAASTSSPLSLSPSILNNCVVQQSSSSLQQQQNSFGGSKHFSGAHYLWEQQQQRNSNLSNNSSAAPFQCSFVRVRTVNVVRPLNPYVVYWTTTSPAPSPSHLFSPITMETRYIFKTKLLYRLVPPTPLLMYFSL